MLILRKKREQRETTDQGKWKWWGESGETRKIIFNWPKYPSWYFEKMYVVVRELKGRERKTFSSHSLSIYGRKFWRENTTLEPLFFHLSFSLQSKESEICFSPILLPCVFFAHPFFLNASEVKEGYESRGEPFSLQSRWHLQCKEEPLESQCIYNTFCFQT